MGISFTPDQQKVIDLHHRNILVSAAAGSGKTAVLVERIIQMVCNEESPVDIDRLLIVTFTNAAAAEMRERISQGIAKQLKLHPQSEHIERQATLLHNALITTIDSFCLYLIRNHFQEIGLDPAFRVADEGEVKLLKQDVLGELLEERFAEKREKFINAVEFFCPGGRETILEEMILDFYTFAMSYPWPEEWLEDRKQDYYIETVEQLESSDVGRYALRYLQSMLHGCEDSLKQALKLCEEPDGPYMYGELLKKELESLQKMASCTHLRDYESMIFAVDFARLPGKKDSSVSAEKREKAKDLRNSVKETLKELQNAFFARSLVSYVKQLQASSLYMEELVDLTLEFMYRLRLKKQEKKILDFHDMEHFALQILINREQGQMEPSSVAKEYRDHFAEILIDEYQDSNLVQEYLLKVISGEEIGRYNRFMVGDVKQSIYKFRLARPELFLEKYDTYTLEEGKCQRIDLSKNFRSRKEVVDTVNHVFSRIMSREKGGIDYDDSAALYVGASYPENIGCKSELLLVEKPIKGDDLNAKQAEGRIIASKIKELKGSFQVTDKATGNLRPVRFSDMVILLRSNSGWDEELKEVLQKEGIPVYISSKTGYFSATEVQEILQFLRVLDNPGQDIPLFGVMKSVFGGFSEDEIGMLRGENKKVSLWQAVKESSWEKVIAFREMIERYREYTIYMPIHELLQKIVEDFSYLYYVAAMPAGSKRKANIEMLFTKAKAFESTSYYGLFHFVRYIEQLEKYDVDFGEAELVDENADLVRIMSIHKSKGLEFPVTFVAGMSKHFNMQDANASFLMDMDMGIAADHVDIKERTKSKTFRRAVLSRKMKEDNLAEELRVLYVALTRAKEKLIMTASLSKAAERVENELGSSKGGMTIMEYLNAGSYLDLVLPVLDENVADISIYNTEELFVEEMLEQLDLDQKKEKLHEADLHGDAIIMRQLKDRFEQKYMHEHLAELYTKTTVSELKIAAMAEKDEAAFHTFEEKEVERYEPAFRREKEAVSGTVRGNAYHKVMELLDFETIYQGKGPEENLAVFLREQVQKGALSEEYKNAVNERKVLNFLKDPIALRISEAQKKGALYKEQPFVFGISADRLNKGFPEEEKVLIQGIIDLFFVEEDGIVLLDYKTDRVQSGQELWERYETQLDYYEEALCKVMNLPVKERILYSFALEKCVKKV